MLTVNEILVFDCTDEGVEQLVRERKIRPFRSKQLKTTFWSTQVAPRLAADESVLLLPTFNDWVAAPIASGNARGQFVSVSSNSPFGPVGRLDGAPTGLALQSTQEKIFTSIDALIAALRGHVAATDNRQKEERLALDVLANVKMFERYVLDRLIGNIQRAITSRRRNCPEGESYYGPGATLDWTRDIVDALATELPLTRLYKKVAAIHDFCRCNRFETPNRGTTRGMRIENEKYSLEEGNSWIANQRSLNNSIWAGKSGSAMDMVYAATQMGIEDDDSLAALAFCIVAFFHFMPTSQSSTHTYHEVMTGATSVHKGIETFYKAAEVPGGQDVFRQLQSRPSLWKPDDSVQRCPGCNTAFGVFTRKHHCRACGGIFCDNCSKETKVVPMPAIRPGKAPETGTLRVCKSCASG
jgi:hypothetical protein